MKPYAHILERLRCSRLAAGLAALAGVLLYAGQSLYYAHYLPSTLDEGNYLYKGLLFARGIYQPFQDYGPWTNKMPLAFLIPGWAQDLLGPGLRSGRYFAVFLGVLMLAGIWLAARRLGGKWWGAAAVLAVALNPGLIMMYSQALSEGLIACMLAWMFVFLLGPGRSPWQIVAGSALSALIVVTRQNMLPVAAFAVLYITWENGWRKGLYALMSAGGLLLLFHAIYWPEIMRLWTPWLPFKLPFQVRAVPGRLLAAVPVGPDSGAYFSTAANPLGDFLAAVYPIWDALRYYFVPIFGTISALLLVPRRSRWNNPANYRASVSLLALLLVLTAAHAWAAMGNDYCVYCFSIYLSFFSLTGLLLVAASWQAWRQRISVVSGLLAALVIPLYAAGTGLGAYGVLADPLLNLQIPRVSGMRIRPGTTELWRSLSNKFGWSFEDLQRMLPTAAGLALGVLLLLAAAWLAGRLARRGSSWSGSALALCIFLALGALLSPTPLFGGVGLTDCGGDVIQSYEAAGQALAGQLPAGALIYWRGGLSPVPLLYLPEIRIFPPQLNSGYNFSNSTDTDRVYRRGLWNKELSQQWLNEADYVLVEDRTYRGNFKDEIDPARYNELNPTPPIATCREGSKIRVFRREK